MTSLISGRILDSGSDPLIEGDIQFVPQSTPYVSGSDIVSSAILTATTDNNGDFSITLVAGVYKVLIPDTDYFYITVPNDGNPYDIQDILSSPLASVKEGLDALNLSSIEQLEAIFETTRAINWNRKGDRDAAVTRTVFVGNVGTADAESSLVAGLVLNTLFEVNGATNLVVLGNLNYGTNDDAALDDSFGSRYQSLVFPYSGGYGDGAADEVNKVWPVPGVEDWKTGILTPYTDFFLLPTNGSAERYYHKVFGNVHLFFLDSVADEPDGNGVDSDQYDWLVAAIAASTSKYKGVVMGDAPKSSGISYTATQMDDWDFPALGVDFVIGGNSNTYERLLVGTVPYFIVGTGGHELDAFAAALAETQYRQATDFGALLLEETEYSLTFTFYNTDEEVMDTYTYYPADSGKMYADVRRKAGGYIKIDADGLYIDYDALKADLQADASEPVVTFEEGASVPEGLVTGNVGKLYLRTGIALYVKTSGTGNTGWTPIINLG